MTRVACQGAIETTRSAPTAAGWPQSEARPPLSPPPPPTTAAYPDSSMCQFDPAPASSLRRCRPRLSRCAAVGNAAAAVALGFHLGSGAAEDVSP